MGVVKTGNASRLQLTLHYGCRSVRGIKMVRTRAKMPPVKIREEY